MAQIIIAKHRKGGTGDVLLTFRGEFTRFENPDEHSFKRRKSDDVQDGEIIGSRVNGGDAAPVDTFSTFGDEMPAPIDNGPLPF